MRQVVVLIGFCLAIFTPAAGAQGRLAQVVPGAGTLVGQEAVRLGRPEPVELPLSNACPGAKSASQNLESRLSPEDMITGDMLRGLPRVIWAEEADGCHWSFLTTSPDVTVAALIQELEDNLGCEFRVVEQHGSDPHQSLTSPFRHWRELELYPEYPEYHYGYPAP